MTLFFGITIVALGLALYSTNIELAQTERQLDNHVQETGRIRIDQRNVVYVRPLNRPAPLVFNYQLALPDSSRFMLKIAEGTLDSLEVLVSKEIFGPRSGYNHPKQQTISIYARRHAVDWRVGYVTPGSSNECQLDLSRLDWMEGVDSLGPLWNPPPGIQRKVLTYNPDETIELLSTQQDVTQNSFGLPPKPTQPKLENPRMFKIWLEPIPVGPKAIGKVDK